MGRGDEPGREWAECDTPPEWPDGGRRRLRGNGVAIALLFGVGQLDVVRPCDDIK